MFRFEAGVATRLEMEQAADQLSEQKESLMKLYNYNLFAALFKYGILTRGGGSNGRKNCYLTTNRTSVFRF